ncbi:MAG: SIMPL domain-containing protein [Rufibacter sp.]
MKVIYSLTSDIKANASLLILSLICLLASCGQPAAVEKKQVKVLGYGSVTSYPDYAEISVESSFTKDRMKDAVHEVQVVTNEVLALAKQFTKTPEDIRVSSTSANKEYHHVNGKERFLGYNSSQSITVKITDLERLETFMEELLKTRINRIQRIKYSHTKADSLKREASALALADATKAADHLCKATNSTKGQVVEISNYQTLEDGGWGESAEQSVSVGLYGKGLRKWL